MTLGPGVPGVAGAVQVPQVLNMDGLVFPKGGQYGFDVRVDGDVHVTLPLMVTDVRQSARA